MSLLSRLNKKIEEAKGRLVKKVVIRDGKKQLISKREYSTECKPGYKRDPETGSCVPMSPEERRNRSVAAKKAANKPSTKRNKSTAARRRASLLGSD